MLKRILLFLLTNLAVIAVISILLSIFNVQPYLTAQGLSYSDLLAYAAIVGFSGAIISLFLSKFLAKQAFNIQMITEPKNEREQWLLSTVSSLAREHRINMPDVGIYYHADPNAFATGWNKNDALLAVSSGLLNSMNYEELEGVLGHEIAHISNGDMVTLTLIQGVVNTFVIFFARIAAYIVTQFLRRSDRENSGVSNFTYYSVAMLFELLFGILATMIVMMFTRYREFRADAGSAQTVGKDKMIKALKRLQAYQNKSEEALEAKHAPAFSAFMISNTQKFMQLFSSHPPLEARIEALEKMPL